MCAVRVVQPATESALVEQRRRVGLCGCSIKPSHVGAR
jgi:hypothetical protein